MAVLSPGLDPVLMCVLGLHCVETGSQPGCPKLSFLPPGILHLALCLQHKKDTDLLKWIQRMAMKMIRGLEQSKG